MSSQPPEAAARPSFRASGPAYLATISVGHGLKHWYLAAFAVFLPLIEREFVMSALAISAFVTVRSAGAGLPNFFAGYVADRLHRYWGAMLPVSFLLVALAMMLAGFLPWVWGVAAAFALAAMAASFWHPPAISMLSSRFAERRGMAIAFHGAGSGAGEALGPLGVGLILAGLLNDDWRLYVIVSAIPGVVRRRQHLGFDDLGPLRAPQHQIRKGPADINADPKAGAVGCFSSHQASS